MKKTGMLSVIINFGIIFLLVSISHATLQDMYFALKGPNDGYLRINSMTAAGLMDDSSWTTLTTGIETDRAPAMAVYEGRIWLAWRVPQATMPKWPYTTIKNAILYRFSDTSGDFNSVYAGGPYLLTDGQTEDSPALAVFNDRLYLAVKGMNNGIYIRYVTGTLYGGKWSDWENVPGSTKNGPAIAAGGPETNRQLFMAVRGGDDSVYLSSLHTWETKWTQKWQSMGGLVDDAPALAWHKNNLFIVVKNFWFIWVKRMDFDAHVFTAWQWIPGLTNDTPAVAPIWDQVNSVEYLIMSARGLDNKLYCTWLDSNSLINWSYWITPSNKIYFGDSPAMTPYP